jgi:lysophospholipase L1-like esterase
MMKNWICLFVFMFLGSTALAQATPEPGGEKKKGDPAYAKVVDDPKLPRVLIIGDSISIGYTPALRELLKGKANVHRIPTNGGPTSNGVKNVEAWLGKEKWDVIHFNFGLHDLKVMPDGKHQVERDQYEQNLAALVDRFQKTGAKLIWATTTPVPEGTLNPPRRFGDVAEYNAVAAKVMAEKKVAIDDLNAAVTPNIKTLQKPHDVHYTAQGYKVLAAEVAKSIEAALK